MPKRTTLTFTSYDAPKFEDSKLFVYYCKYSGKHAFTTDVDIASLPRRRADKAYVLDREKHLIKLYTSDGGTKHLRRADGTIERQCRLNIGKLPVAYTSEPDGALLYIMDNAVTSYHRELDASERVPVPPCIKRGPSGNTEVILEIEDRGTHTAVGKITAEHVKVHITGNAAHDVASQELLALMARTLGVRLTQLMLQRGQAPRSRVLLVESLSPMQTFRRLKGEAPPRAAQQDDGARKRRPWHHGL